MTTPSAALVAALENLPGDIIVLGVGGKIGPSLAQLAKRAAPGKRVVGVARFSEKGLREKLAGCGHRMRRGRPPRPQADRGAAETRQRGVHGRTQVRLLRPRGPDLGDERPRARPRGRGVRAFAHRRLLDRLRVPLCQRPSWRRHRGDRGDPAARRLCQFLRGARGHVPILLAHAWNAGAHHPPQLCDRHALRRAARRRRARARGRADQSHCGPRQRDLARRCQCHGAARAGSLHRAVEPAQCQRPGDRERALAGRIVRRSAWASRRFSLASKPPRAGWSTPPRRRGCSVIRACRC